MPSDCPSDPALSNFLAGDLPVPEATAVSSHLRACAQCSARVEELASQFQQTSQVLADLPATPPVVPADPEFHAAIARLLDQPPRAHDPAIGDLVDDYRLVELIGEGGMGRVFRAVHTRLDKLVALKVIRRHRALDPSIADRFRREMRAMGKVRHPNLVQATDAGVAAAGFQYLVMDYVPGTNLSRLVSRDGPLPLKRACELVRQAAVGLHHAHEHGLVHRDVKPSNLLLGDDGTVRVLDLGLALLPDELEPPGKPAPHSATTALLSADDTLTAPGQQLGTRDYTAPEQLADSHRVDRRADIYSLGATLVYLLTRSPYRLGDPFPPELPEPLARLLLAPNPENRFATAQAAAEGLAAVCAPAQPPAPRARRPWLVPAALGVLAVAVGTFLLNRPPKPDGLSRGEQEPKPLEEAPMPRWAPERGKYPMNEEQAVVLQRIWVDRVQKPIMVRGKTGTELRIIPPGEFLLSGECRVRIRRPYYLGAYEVTVAQFRAFVEATKYQTSAVTTGQGGFILKPSFKPGAEGRQLTSNPLLSWENPGHASLDPDQSVCMVSWNDAVAYCKWLSERDDRTYRLPTEAELTWAMRCGDPGSEYIDPAGPLPLELGWHRRNCEQPQPVGKLKANAWGLFDTYGNVAEFCADRAGPLPVGTFDDFEGTTDPGRARRVFIGYSYLTPAFKPQPLRDNALPDQSWGHVGFRVACDAQ